MCGSTDRYNHCLAIIFIFKNSSENKTKQRREKKKFEEAKEPNVYLRWMMSTPVFISFQHTFIKSRSGEKARINRNDFNRIVTTTN